MVVVLVAVVVVLVDGAEVQTATYKQYLLPSHLSSSHHVQTGSCLPHSVTYFVN